MSFWQIIWFIIVSFAFIAYLIILFNIFADLFRDHRMSGWLKAIWIILLIVFPFISAFVYVIARGPGMAERQAASLSNMRAAQGRVHQVRCGERLACSTRSPRPRACWTAARSRRPSSTP